MPGGKGTAFIPCWHMYYRCMWRVGPAYSKYTQYCHQVQELAQQTVALTCFTCRKQNSSAQLNCSRTGLYRNKPPSASSQDAYRLPVFQPTPMKQVEAGVHLHSCSQGIEYCNNPHDSSLRILKILEEGEHGFSRAKWEGTPIELVCKGP